MKTNSSMNDDERKAAWARVTDPREALEELLGHSEFVGTDPYYRDLNNALWEMAGRVLQMSQEPATHHEKMTMMVDRAMTEVQNIHPPVTRDLCRRLIQAAMKPPERVAYFVSEGETGYWQTTVDGHPYTFRLEPIRRRVRHNKRGTYYRVIGTATAQISTDDLGKNFELGRIRHRMLREHQKLTVYQSEHDLSLWVRFPDEFEDGRFEDVGIPKVGHTP